MQMQKTLGVLTVLLAAQVLLAVAMNLAGPDLTAVKPDTALVDLGDRSVDRIVISGPDRQQLVLQRQGDSWVLPGTDGFPAATDKVNHLLDRLTGLKRGLAVATTAGAQQRFKVGAGDFERRVQLDGGDETLATVYFGTSPGLRRMHARTDRDAAVYTAAFGLYEAPIKASGWEDKTVLHLKSGDIDRIDLAGFAMQRSGAPPAPSGQDNSRRATAAASWQGEKLGEGETLKQPGATALVQKLAGLDIDSVLGKKPQPDYGLQTPALALSVRRKDGKTLEYRLGKRDKQHDYVLKVSSRPEYFRLPAFTGDALVKAAGRDQLVIASTPQPAAANAGGPVASAPPAATAVPDSHAAKEGTL
jgi:hypothetical protein